jgi:putative Holliday junction resolvase
MIYKTVTDFKQHLKDNQRLLAIDYGAKKTGIALSDRKRQFATPCTTIFSSSQNVVIDEINKLIEENLIGGIVIGFPFSSSNQESPLIEKIYLFAESLVLKFNLPILLFCERNTSKMANDLLINLNLKRKRRNMLDDKIAASIILQNVIEELNKNS